MADELMPYPEPGSRDDAHIATNAALAGFGSLVPFLGAATAALFNDLFRPSIEKQRDQWGRQVTELLNDLTERQIDIAELAAREEWISAVGRANRAAWSTLDEEKMKMLRRVLTRMALDTDSNPVVADRFVRYVDDFEVVHFLILGFIQDPLNIVKQLELDVDSAITEALVSPERSPQAGRMDQNEARLISLKLFAASHEIDEVTCLMVHNDLEQERLVDLERDSSVDLRAGFGQDQADIRPWPTQLGEQLLDWVFEG